jgi:hypothetical protein
MSATKGAAGTFGQHPTLSFETFGRFDSVPESNRLEREISWEKKEKRPEQVDCLIMEESGCAGRLEAREAAAAGEGRGAAKTDGH